MKKKKKKLENKQTKKVIQEAHLLFYLRKSTHEHNCLTPLAQYFSEINKQVYNLT